VKYEIEDYDTMTCMRREEEFKTMPGSLAAYTTNFFLITSEVLVLDSLKSLRDKMIVQQQVLEESLKRISQDGDGFPISGSLQEKEQSK
jgi:hypothetical protein